MKRMCVQIFEIMSSCNIINLGSANCQIRLPSEQTSPTIYSWNYNKKEEHVTKFIGFNMPWKLRVTSC